MTYAAVLAEVNRVANWLKSQGVRSGDSVAIYLPMVLELPITMLACARLGAVHSVVFGGFSSDALADRIMDSTPRVLVTASGVMRGKKVIELKQIADAACATCKSKGHEARIPSHSHARVSVASARSVRLVSAACATSWRMCQLT